MAAMSRSVERQAQRGVPAVKERRFASEVRCLHCARLMGSWEWTANAPQGLGRFTPVEGVKRRELLWRLRCDNCGGPAFLGEVEPVRELEEFVWTPMKRGRKPKQEAA